MRIQDIISEAGVGQAVGTVAGKAARGVGTVAGGAVGAAKMAHQGFKQGQDKMDKILNPKRWFSKDDDTKEPTAQPTAVAEPHENRRILQQAGQGRELFLQDKQNLKALHTGISAGDIPTNIDQTTLLLALKAAYKGQQLNDNQKKLLTQFSQQF
jgi:hypothetical protein